MCNFTIGGGGGGGGVVIVGGACAEDFTQLVWKGTEYVGFGCAINQDGDAIFIAAHYSPKGNVDGEFLKNVLKPHVGDTFTDGWNLLISREMEKLRPRPSTKNRKRKLLRSNYAKEFI
ncbi:unnamed protein product [Dicrocoelium dendriticum]|nr:unnamed protein product [Dicrocoelium dendriticum]